MLTTIDNPFCPFTEYDEWYAYDKAKGHNSCELLAYVTKTSHELSDLDNELAIDLAIDEIIREDDLFKFKRAERKIETSE